MITNKKTKRGKKIKQILNSRKVGSCFSTELNSNTLYVNVRVMLRKLLMQIANATAAAPSAPMPLVAPQNGLTMRASFTPGGPLAS